MPEVGHHHNKRPKMRGGLQQHEGKTLRSESVKYIEEMVSRSQMTFKDAIDEGLEENLQNIIEN